MVHDARPAIARGIFELATVGPTGQGEDIRSSRKEPFWYPTPRRARATNSPPSLFFYRKLEPASRTGVPSAPWTSPTPPPLPPPPGDSPRLLLVDSVLPILRALASILDPYVIEMATSGAQALARLATLPAIDVVLCDLHLDDLDGRELYRQACAQQPELRGRFAFMTGDCNPPHRLDDDFGGVRVLSRPFEPELLHALLHDLVNGLPPSAEA